MRRLCQKCAKCGRPMLALVVWACDGLVVEGLGWPRTGRGSKQAGGRDTRAGARESSRTHLATPQSHTTTINQIAHNHTQNRTPPSTNRTPPIFLSHTYKLRAPARANSSHGSHDNTAARRPRARESEWGEPSRGGPVCRGASSCAVVGCRRAGSTPHVYHTTVRVG